MPGKTIGVSLNLGYPGTFSRNADCVIMARPATGEIPFGVPLVMNADNTFSKFGAGHDGEDFVGVSVRVVKQQTDYYSENVVYKDKEPVDCLSRGSVIVKVTGGKPAGARAPVYIRVTENSTDFPDAKVGDFSAVEDSGNCVLLPDVVFTTGQTDDEGVAEITVLRRNA